MMSGRALKSQDVTVIISAHNEEKSIYKCLQSTYQAMRYAGIDRSKLAVCANACTDGTEAEISRFHSDYSEANVKRLTTAGSLVSAQRAAVATFPSSCYVFIDADCIVDSRALLHLLSALDEDKSKTLAYGRTVSLVSKPKGLVSKVNELYNSQKLLTKRYYFHGRIFATRIWCFPTPEEAIKKASNSKHKHLLKYSVDDEPLAADDVFLSTFIWDMGSIDSIVEVRSAKVYAWLTTSYRDWRQVYRRTFIEVAKIIKWFPEYDKYRYLHFRKTNWRVWRKSTLSEKILWLHYLLMRMVFYIVTKAEIILAKLPFIQPRPQWITAASTKKPIEE